jgi:hypothetical protein
MEVFVCPDPTSEKDYTVVFKSRDIFVAMATIKSNLATNWIRQRSLKFGIDKQIQIGCQPLVVTSSFFMKPRFMSPGEGVSSKQGQIFLLNKTFSFFFWQTPYSKLLEHVLSDRHKLCKTFRSFFC